MSNLLHRMFGPRVLLWVSNPFGGGGVDSFTGVTQDHPAYQTFTL